jgi:hypothetical protein
VEIIEKAVGSAPSQNEGFNGGGRGAAVMMAAIVSAAALDPMLCVVADTLTLPVTIPLQERKIAREQEISPPSTLNAPTAP